MKLHRIDEIGYVVVICDCGYMLRVRGRDYRAECPCGRSEVLSAILTEQRGDNDVKPSE